jgi:hypothetical protein
MRLFKVAVLALMVVLAVPLHADNKPEQPIVQPSDDGSEGCVECSRMGDWITCGGTPTGAGWMNCEGGWIYLCDGYAGCDRVPNCGSRCAIA